MPQELKKRVGLVKEFVPHGDKHSRLVSVSHMIQGGYVRFPKRGCETLIEQLVGFGVERHDDLVDALVMVILEVLSTPCYNGLGYDTKEEERERRFERMKKHNPFLRKGTLQEDLRRERQATIAGNLFKMKF